MSKKKLAALTLLAATALPAAHADPGQDEIEKLLVQKGLVARLGDTIHQATDRGGVVGGDCGEPNRPATARRRSGPQRCSAQRCSNRPSSAPTPRTWPG